VTPFVLLHKDGKIQYPKADSQRRINRHHKKHLGARQKVVGYQAISAEGH